MPKGTSGNIKGRNDKHLTNKQIKFAKEFVYNDGSKTQTECAIAAGYSKESAHVRASELLNPQKYPVVVRYIRELQAEVDRKYEVTFGRHVRKLADIRDQALEKGNLTAAVSAEVQRGRAAGLYVERKEIRTGSLDSLSETEIKKRIKDLLSDYKPLLEAEEAVFTEGSD
jgi:phage terminase small subunit|tara:strand:+ start:639 stop:1148 length:510 start_codon:yes stop_codon:yes gene_type:complete